MSLPALQALLLRIMEVHQRKLCYTPQWLWRATSAVATQHYNEARDLIDQAVPAYIQGDRPELSVPLLQALKGLNEITRVA